MVADTIRWAKAAIVCLCEIKLEALSPQIVRSLGSHRIDQGSLKIRLAPLGEFVLVLILLHFS